LAKVMGLTNKRWRYYRMKKKIVILGLVMLVLLLLVAPVAALAAKPATFDVEYNQTQFQWRANRGQVFGEWWQIYQNSPSSSEFRLTGNVLHSAYTYSPAVTDLDGESTVYVYNKKADSWIEKEGTVSYRYEPLYGEYPIVNYWRGYLKFDGTPSADSFVHGVAYQWAYLLAPQDMSSPLPYSIWCDTMCAWLVGFSIYLWDTDTQSYNVPFPDPFMAPVPASNYNPVEGL